MLDAMWRTRHIPYTHYEESNLYIFASEIINLTEEGQETICNLLSKHNLIFDRTLGTLKTCIYRTTTRNQDIQSKTIPNTKGTWINIQEISGESIFQPGMIKRGNISEWGSLNFIKPRYNRMVRLFYNFRKMNQRIIRKMFPIPKI